MCWAKAVDKSCLPLLILIKVSPESKIVIFIIAEFDVFSVGIKNKAKYYLIMLQPLFSKCCIHCTLMVSNCVVNQHQNYGQVTKLRSPDA